MTGDNSHKPTSKTPNKSRHGRPPRILRPNALLAPWLLVTATLYYLTYTIQFQSDLSFSIDSLDAPDLLYINAGMLATMLVVTLGVTLLGLQFRAQSYTLVGLIDYASDKVVYGFIGVFLGGTVFSMVAAIQPPSFPDPAIMVPYAIIHTFFSLCYHAVYIYHVIYNLQPSQILNDANKKMEDVISKSLKNPGNDDVESMDIEESSHIQPENTRPFEIWSDMMKNAIATNNKDLFDDGIKNMIYIMTDEKYSYLQKNSINNFTIQYVKNIMCFCIEQKQYRLIDDFLEAIMKNNILIITEDTSDIPEWKIELLKILSDTIHQATKHNEYITFKIIMDIMLVVLNDSLEKCDDNIKSKMYTAISTIIYDVMQSCIEQNHHMLTREFMISIKSENMMLFNQNDTEFIRNWRLKKLLILEQIMLKAVDNDDVSTFLAGIDTMMITLLKNMEKFPDNEIKHYVRICAGNTTNVLKSCIEQNRYRLEQAFLSEILAADLLMLKQNNSRMQEWMFSMLDILAQMMFKAVNVDDQYIFRDEMFVMVNSLCDIIKSRQEPEIEQAFEMCSMNLVNIIRSCMTQNRNILINVFTNHILDGLLMLDVNHNVLYDWRLRILIVLEKVILKAIDDDDLEVFMICMTTMVKSLDEIVKKCPDDKTIELALVCTIHTREIMKSCIKQNRHQLGRGFIAKISNGEFLLVNHTDSNPAKTWRLCLSEILEDVMKDYISKNDNELFIHILSAIINLLHIVLDKCSDDEKKELSYNCWKCIDDAVTSCIEDSQNDLIREFLICSRKGDTFLTNQEDPEIKKAWESGMWDILKRIIFYFIRTKNYDLFQTGISTISYIHDNHLEKYEDKYKINVNFFNITDSIIQECSKYNLIKFTQYVNDIISKKNRG